MRERTPMKGSRTDSVSKRYREAALRINHDKFGRENDYATQSLAGLTRCLASTRGYVLYRHFEIERLAKVVLSPSSGTASADSAIGKLSAYHGSWATDSLLTIATAMAAELLKSEPNFIGTARATTSSPKPTPRATQRRNTSSLVESASPWSLRVEIRFIM